MADELTGAGTGWVTGQDGVPVTFHIGVYAADAAEVLATRNHLMDLLATRAKARVVLVNGTDVWLVMAPMPVGLTMIIWSCGPRP
jgi:hypothetical protein